MIEPIPASEAKQSSKNKARILAEQELQTVYPLIQQACSEGLFKIHYDGKLSENALNRLEELGYTVTDMKSQDRLVKISWYG